MSYPKLIYKVWVKIINSDELTHIMIGWGKEHQSRKNKREVARESHEDHAEGVGFHPNMLSNRISHGAVFCFNNWLWQCMLLSKFQEIKASEPKKVQENIFL